MRLVGEFGKEWNRLRSEGFSKEEVKEMLWSWRLPKQKPEDQLEDLAQ
jgi:hypothetical protein